MRFQDVATEGDFLKIKELTAATPITSTAPATGSATVAQVQQDPQAQQKMMAQQALDRQNKKKEIQDQIRAKQQELVELQKQLAQIR